MFPLCMLGIFYCSNLIFAQTQTLQFWSFWSLRWIGPAIEAFEKENPNVKIEYERLTYQEGRSKIIIALAAREAPDVLEFGSTWSAELFEAGAFEEIDIQKNNIDIYGLNLGRWKEKLYALPWVISVNALFYNKDLLANAGFETPPKDWDELLTQVKAIHNPKKRVYGYGFKLGAETTWQKFLPFAWSNGGTIFQPDLATPSVQEKPFVQAVAFGKQLVDYGLLDDNLRVRHAFLQGRVGFMLDDAGQITYLQKNAPNLRFGVVSLPKSPRTKSRQSFGGAQLLGISSDSEKKALALKFVQFMTRLENVRLITDKIFTLYPPSKEGLQSDFYTKEHPELLVFLQELPYTRSTPQISNWIDIQKTLVFQLERTFFGMAQPQEAMDAVAAHIKKFKPIVKSE